MKIIENDELLIPKQDKFDNNESKQNDSSTNNNNDDINNEQLLEKTKIAPCYFKKHVKKLMVNTDNQ